MFVIQCRMEEPAFSILVFLVLFFNIVFFSHMSRVVVFSTYTESELLKFMNSFVSRFSFCLYCSCSTLFPIYGLIKSYLVFKCLFVILSARGTPVVLCGSVR